MSARNIIYNIPLNLFSNTFGYFIAKKQNRRAFEILKTDKKKTLVYIASGWMQNEGGQYIFARQLFEQGYLPIHLKCNVTTPGRNLMKASKSVMSQIIRIKNENNLSSRNDIYSGHSAAGDVGILLAHDRKILKTGIKKIQARSPNTKYKVENVLGKILSWIMPQEKPDSGQGKKILKIIDSKSLIDVYIVAGKKDNLVPYKYSEYKYAKRSKVILGKDSTHFGLSGCNPKINKIFIKLIDSYYNVRPK